MKKLSIIIIVLMAILVCCKKTPEVNIKYVDIEREVLTIGATTANIQCDYEYISTLKSAKLYYGINETTSYVEMRVVQSALYAEISGLNGGTTYQYYYEFTNGFNSMQSAVKTFVTENSSSIVLPTIITADISGITNNSAVCGGQVTDNGGGSVTARGVCWSTLANPTVSDSHTTDDSGLGTFTSNITGLSSNTTYHVRAYATNESGTAYGLDKTFTTLDDGGTIELPIVVTSEVVGVTAHGASCGGNVISDGGATVTARGICWSTNANPTINDNHVASGSGMGSYSESMTGLASNTIYHVRAYATNEAGTAYGLDKEFTTLNGGGGGDVPTGAIDGLFTINANGDQVYFSQGNLQYQASTNTWRFAENQWNYVGSSEVYFLYPGGNVPGSSNHLISASYSGWIDLFGWGTSGYNHGAISYQPWSTSDNDSQYYAYGDVDKNLNDETGQADWGYNAITNGGNEENVWRTMSYEEWLFVISYRSTPSGILYAKAYVNETNGLILLPDNWDPSIYSLNNTNNGESPYLSNTINLSDWGVLENNGAVFLPVTGIRNNSGCGWMNGGHYQTTSISYDDHIYVMNLVFQNDILYFSGGLYSYRYIGASIRLVQDNNNK